MPTISVVIPLYNKAPYISRALSSVLLQSFEDYEVIVVDDGSTDDGKSIAEGFSDPRIRVLHQQNGGVSAARNLGIQSSRCDLIAFLDADDEWGPDFLETILSLKKTYPQAGAYGTAFEMRFPDGSIVHPEFNEIYYGWEGILPSYFRASFGVNVLHSSAVAVPAKVFLKIGLFPEGEKLGEDLDMWLRIAASYPIAYKNIACEIYNLDACNRTDVLPISVDDLCYLKTAREIIHSRKISTEMAADIADYITARKIAYAKDQIKQNQPLEGRRILKGLKTDRFAAKRRLWLFASYIPYKIFGLFRYITRRLRLI